MNIGAENIYKEIGRVLIELLSQHFPWQAEENHEKSVRIARPVLEPSTSRIPL
jgi:hypothetical protein